MDFKVEYLQVYPSSEQRGIYSPLYNTLTYGPVIELLYSSKMIFDANSTY